MKYIDEQLIKLKLSIEKAIIEKGTNGKSSIIRSSELINLIHDAVKYELISEGVNEKKIYPPLNANRPEINLAGYLKQKKQDVCVMPSNIEKNKTKIDWGPLAFANKEDEFGYRFSTNMLVINIRSQMSSIAKNTDTLFERTFAEALNLHMRYKEMVLGEVYLIPVYAYDDKLAKKKKVGFTKKITNIEKYINFFQSINLRKVSGDDCYYERCALLIVDFNREIPKIYESLEELKKDKVVSKNFECDMSNLAFSNFAKDLLKIYAQRYNIDNLKE